uniref:Noggin n=1 Tax=Echeneis naucrates TaxID=173247 RepID=A0A665UDD3_ECHNA
MSSFVHLCWISVSVFLYGVETFALNISTQNQLPNVTVAQEEEDRGWESLFLQLRASLPSFSQPIRPYTLLTTTEHYQYLMSFSLELRKAAARHRRKLETQAAVRSWLVSSATCELDYQWMDLGPAFWPRWLRQTDCEASDGTKSCSFPIGMKCARAQTTHINILAWHCMEIRDGTIKCLWRQVPYPVVTACNCSCK